MTKALNVSDDVYLTIFNKWVELKKEGENVRLGKIAEDYIKIGAEIINKKLDPKEEMIKEHIKLVSKDDVR